MNHLLNYHLLLFSSPLFTKLPFSMTRHHHHHHLCPKPSIVVIMGATGTGKTKLSIDLASRLNSDVINSDKIQVYSGLDITTNKIPIHHRRGVLHHLLGSVDPSSGELAPSSFKAMADQIIRDAEKRGKIPIVAGGSNSLIQALVSEKYRCCFLWVHVEEAELREYLDRRVEEMVGSGMVEELEGYFRNSDWKKNAGLNKAIGVPEFWGFFGDKNVGYEETVTRIKENTWRLAKEQMRKIGRLEEVWDLIRVDATDVVRAKLSGSLESVEDERWERDVASPAFGAVEKFLKSAGGKS